MSISEIFFLTSNPPCLAKIPISINSYNFVFFFFTIRPSQAKLSNFMGLVVVFIGTLGWMLVSAVQIDLSIV